MFLIEFLVEYDIMTMLISAVFESATLSEAEAFTSQRRLFQREYSRV